jgi:hypothetical protein
MSSNPPYRSRAVRALVLLHEEHLRRFVRTWRLALAKSVSLQPTEDPAYASLGALGQHVLGAAGGYMVWMCEMLTLPDPGIRSAPDAAAVIHDAEDYMGARSGAVAGPATRSSRRTIGDSRVRIAMADALLYRLDVGARCHAPDPPRLPVG